MFTTARGKRESVAFAFWQARVLTRHGTSPSDWRTRNGINKLTQRPARPLLHREQKDCFGGTPKVRAGLALTRETRALPGGRCGEQLADFFVAGLGKIFVVLADAHE